MNYDWVLRGFETMRVSSGPGGPYWAPASGIVVGA